MPGADAGPGRPRADALKPAAIAAAVGAGVCLLAAAGLLLTACGGPRRGPQLRAERAAIDALVAEGCYTCLDEALVRLFALPQLQGARGRARDTELFRLNVLLALREKELGIDPSQRLRQAAALVPTVTDPAIAREQLRWAELVPSNPSGLPQDVAHEQRLGLANAQAEVNRRLLAGPSMSDAVDVYLNVSLACEVFRAPPVEPAALATPAGTHAVVQWRLATCGRRQEKALQAFAAAHPRYVEAEYVLGRFGMALVGDPKARRDARERLQRALEAFPQSPAIAFDLAGVWRVTSAKTALPLYERVTRAQPGHHEAWLGKGICLTYLERPQHAIEALSRVVALGRWFVGDALYWRAWNRLTLGDLEPAWIDVEEARKTLYNTDVYGLAGRIAFERQQLDTARPLLEKARELSEANCAAGWYLGLVHSGQQRWLESGRAFEATERCYAAERERIVAERRLADASDEAPDADARAATDAAVATAERQAALSAFNAGYSLVQGGERQQARPLVERAVAHPAISDRARELLAFLDRPPVAAPRSAPAPPAPAPRATPPR